EVVEVNAHRAFAVAHLPGERLGGRALGEQLEHLALLLGQRRRLRHRKPRSSCREVTNSWNSSTLGSEARSMPRSCVSARIRLSKPSTSLGSNWRPALRRSSARASSMVLGG